MKRAHWQVNLIRSIRKEERLVFEEECLATHKMGRLATAFECKFGIERYVAGRLRLPACVFGIVNTIVHSDAPVPSARRQRWRWTGRR